MSERDFLNSMVYGMWYMAFTGHPQLSILNGLTWFGATRLELSVPWSILLVHSLFGLKELRDVKVTTETKGLFVFNVGMLCLSLVYLRK
jgi:hypothetical protein